MDSLTQIVLGAAVAEVVAGKKLGNKALLWGAVGGTIPDLDVVGSFFMGLADYVNFHRGFSHSLVFGFLVAPVLGWLLSKSRWSQGQPFWLWTRLFFWTIFTHPLLDIFTSYGTQIFLPFSDYSVELNTIFIIDPAYTVPMLVAVIAVMFYQREAPGRKKVVWTGILISHAYLLFTIVNKLFWVDPALKKEMNFQNLTVERFESIPAPFQNFLWQGIIKTPEGYYAGYFNPRDHVHFDSFLYFPRDREAEMELEAFDEYQKLKKFSRNYDWVEKVDESRYIYNDMRFSTTKGWLEKDSSDFIFSFKLNLSEGVMSVERNEPSTQMEWKDLSRVFNRVITD